MKLYKLLNRFAITTFLSSLVFGQFTVSSSELNFGTVLAGSTNSLTIIVSSSADQTIIINPINFFEISHTEFYMANGLKFLKKKKF